jgi:hypothetical protein
MQQQERRAEIGETEEKLNHGKGGGGGERESCKQDVKNKKAGKEGRELTKGRKLKRKGSGVSVAVVIS